MSYRDRDDNLLWNIMLGIGMFILLVWSGLRTWGCSVEQKGQVHTNSFNHRVEVCDGEHWVPYIVEQPK